MATITVTGNLTRDPELTHDKNAIPRLQLTVMENRRTRNDEGEWIDLEPNAFTVKVSGVLATNVAASCTKGSRVTVEGYIVTDTWDDNDTGKKRTAQRIIAREISYSLRWATVTAEKNTTPAPIDGDETHTWPVAEIPA